MLLEEERGRWTQNKPELLPLSRKMYIARDYLKKKGKQPKRGMFVGMVSHVIDTDPIVTRGECKEHFVVSAAVEMVAVV